MGMAGRHSQILKPKQASRFYLHKMTFRPLHPVNLFFLKELTKQAITKHHWVYSDDWDSEAGFNYTAAERG